MDDASIGNDGIRWGQTGEMGGVGCLRCGRSPQEISTVDHRTRGIQKDATVGLGCFGKKNKEKKFNIFFPARALTSVSLSSVHITLPTLAREKQFAIDC